MPLAPRFRADGRLLSQDGVILRGRRTLTGTSIETLWGGSATTRPNPGGGATLRLVSSSAEDDASRAQSGTLTLAGTPEAPVADVWTVTIGGTVDAGDIARIVFDGTNYDALIQAEAVVGDVATTMATQLNSGTKDTYNYVIGGTIDIGDIITLTLNGTPYTYEVTGGETAGDVAAQLAGNAAADANYDVTNPIGASVLVQRKVRGVNAGSVSCTWTTDPGLDATCTELHAVTGVDAITGYTATTSTADVLLTQDSPGAAGVVVVSSSYALDPGMDSTAVTVHTATGADGDTYAVDDGTNTFSYPVEPGDSLNDCATALAALINADAAYSAAAVNEVITVTAAVEGVAFAFTDVSTDNQTTDIGITVDDTAVLGNGPGTGIRSVRLWYVSTAGVLTYEDVDLDGTTAVATVASDIDVVWDLVASEVGSNGGAVGTVSLKNAAGSVTYEQIAANACDARPATVEVPARRELVIDEVRGGSTAAVEVTLRSDWSPAFGLVSGATFDLASVRAPAGTTARVSLPSPLRIPATAKVWLVGQGSAAAVVDAVADGWLEEVHS
jgi:hypothetical protein